MRTAYITTLKPVDVAREVELYLKQGRTVFVVVGIDGGHMLDLERLGAARYAAGLQAQVELDAAHSSPAAGSGAPAVWVLSSSGAR